MTVRLGAVEYLNARPLVEGLGRSPRFDVRFDVPSTCADLLHRGAIDVGLIPSIECLRGGPYAIVPALAIASRGPVASVALFTTRSIGDVRSIAMDTSSRTSVALTRVLCARLFRIEPKLEAHGPDLDAMLTKCDAALLIGDKALVEGQAENDRHTNREAGASPGGVSVAGLESRQALASPDHRAASLAVPVEKIDLGDAWTRMTGLPFVYAFWAGRIDALSPEDVAALTSARDEGVARAEEIGREYFSATPEWRELGARYLRDNIKYDLGDSEREGLERFYRYAAEIGVVPQAAPLTFYRR